MPRSAKLRAKYYEAWVTRASDQGPHAGRWDNGPLIEEILRLRHEAARLARLQELRGAIARDEDGRLADSESSNSCATSRAAASRSRRRSSRSLHGVRGPQARPVGHRVLLRAVEAGAACSSPRRSCGRTFRCRACSKGLFGARRHSCSTSRSAERDAPSVWHPTVQLLRAAAAATARSSAASSRICSRGPNKRGGAWMDGCLSRAQAQRQAPRAGRAISSATSIRRSARPRRCSRMARS